MTDLAETLEILAMPEPWPVVEEWLHRYRRRWNPADYLREAYGTSETRQIAQTLFRNRIATGKAAGLLSRPCRKCGGTHRSKSDGRCLACLYAWRRAQ